MRGFATIFLFVGTVKAQWNEVNMDMDMGMRHYQCLSSSLLSSGFKNDTVFRLFFESSTFGGTLEKTTSANDRSTQQRILHMPKMGADLDLVKQRFDEKDHGSQLLGCWSNPLNMSTKSTRRERMEFPSGFMDPHETV